jgi:flagellar biosynthesis GTPase FlhF
MTAGIFSRIRQAMHSIIMRKRIPPTAFLLCCCLVPVFSLLAETIILKNGQQISGSIIRQDLKQVQIMSAGKMITIPKENILKMIYKNSAPDESKQIAPPKSPEASIPKKLEQHSEQERVKALQRAQAIRQQALQQRAEQERLQAIQRAEAARLQELQQRTEQDKLKEAEAARSKAAMQKEEDPTKGPDELEKELDARKTSKEWSLSAVQRSALLPGWGLYADHPSLAIASFALFAGTLANSMLLRQSALAREQSYDRVALLYAPFLTSSEARPLIYLNDLNAKKPYAEAVQRHNDSLNFIAIAYMITLGIAYALTQNNQALMPESPGGIISIEYHFDKQTSRAQGPGALSVAWQTSW